MSNVNRWSVGESQTIDIKPGVLLQPLCNSCHSLTLGLLKTLALERVQVLSAFRANSFRHIGYNKKWRTPDRLWQQSEHNKSYFEREDTYSEGRIQEIAFVTRSSMLTDCLRQAFQDKIPITTVGTREYELTLLLLGSSNGRRKAENSCRWRWRIHRCVLSYSQAFSSRHKDLTSLSAWRMRVIGFV